MRLLLASVFLVISSAASSYAQKSDDGLFCFNIGWAFAKPQATALQAFKNRFDGETGFQHSPMTLSDMSHGGTFGFSMVSRGLKMDFDYQALGLKGSYTTMPGQGVPDENYTFKLSQHAARWAFMGGMTLHRSVAYSGIYLGAAIYGGKWMIKKDEANQHKLEAEDIEGFKWFALGLSPQVTLRAKFIEVKGFYDFPFWKTDLAPWYNDRFRGEGAADARGDDALKSRWSNLGVSVVFSLPLGDLSERKMDIEEQRRQDAEWRRQKSDAGERMENERLNRERQEQKRREDTQRNIEDRNRELDRIERYQRSR